MPRTSNKKIDQLKESISKLEKGLNNPHLSSQKSMIESKLKVMRAELETLEKSEPSKSSPKSDTEKSFNQKLKAEYESLGKKSAHGEPGHFNIFVKDKDSYVTSYGKHDRINVGQDIDDRNIYSVRIDNKWGLGRPEDQDILRVVKVDWGDSMKGKKFVVDHTTEESDSKSIWIDVVPQSYVKNKRSASKKLEWSHKMDPLEIKESIAQFDDKAEESVKIFESLTPAEQKYFYNFLVNEAYAMEDTSIPEQKKDLKYLVSAYRKENTKKDSKSSSKSTDKRKGKKSPVFELAKKIRKEGEKWQDAVKRASKQLKSGAKEIEVDIEKLVSKPASKAKKPTSSAKKPNAKAKKPTSSVLKPNTAKVVKIPQTKKGIIQDKQLTAKHPGKRISKEGKVYYESRSNRSDVDKRKRL